MPYLHNKHIEIFSQGISHFHSSIEMVRALVKVSRAQENFQSHTKTYQITTLTETIQSLKSEGSLKCFRAVQKEPRIQD